MFQGSYKSVSRVFQACSKGVLWVFIIGCSRTFDGGILGVSRKFKGGRKLQVCFKEVSGV